MTLKPLAVAVRGAIEQMIAENREEAARAAYALMRADLRHAAIAREQALLAKISGKPYHELTPGARHSGELA